VALNRMKIRGQNRRNSPNFGWLALSLIIILIAVLSGHQADAYNETSSQPQSDSELTACTGPDCLYRNEMNALKAAAGRKYPSTQQMCELGDGSIPEVEIYNKVKSFCEDPYFPEGENSVFDNDKKLASYSNFSDESDPSIQKFVNDSRFYPDGVFLFLIQSGFNVTDPCGDSDRAKCFQKVRADFMQTDVVGYNMLSYLALGYESLAEPKIQSCVQSLAEAKSEGQNKQFKISPTDAKDFCQALANFNYRQNLFPKLQTNYAFRLTEALKKISASYKRWTKDKISIFSLFWVQQTYDKTLIREAYAKDLQKGATCFALNRTSEKSELVFSPYYQSFLDLPGGNGNLWLVMAHEFGHLLTLNYKGNTVFNEFWDAPTGGSKTMGECADYYYGLSAHGLQTKPSFRAEPIADIFAWNAAAYALPDSAQPHDWRKFMYHATNPWCAMFNSTKPKNVTTEFFKQNNFSSIGHPPVWLRVNALFSNNRLREKLGCKKIEGPARECHEISLQGIRHNGQ
jgi:hypothetical protein